jgi:hypothetical protein
MPDSTVDAGRRRYARKHGDPRTREFDPGEVSGSAIERGRAEFAKRAGNASAAASLATLSGAGDPDARRD